MSNSVSHGYERAHDPLCPYANVGGHLKAVFAAGAKCPRCSTTADNKEKGDAMTTIGDKLALQSIGNAYKIAQHNERQKFNELAAYVRVAYTNGMSQRHISEAVKLHRQTVARIIKGMDDKRRKPHVDLAETNEI